MGGWSTGTTEFTCKCGARYKAHYKDFSERDKGTFNCRLCGEESIVGRAPATMWNGSCWTRHDRTQAQAPARPEPVGNIGMTVASWLQTLSAISALLAAIAWACVALISIPLVTASIWRERQGIVKRPPQELAFKRQGKWNGLGAAFASVAAISQAISTYLTLPISN